MSDISPSSLRFEDFPDDAVVFSRDRPEVVYMKGGSSWIPFKLDVPEPIVADDMPVMTADNFPHSSLMVTRGVIYVKTYDKGWLRVDFAFPQKSGNEAGTGPATEYETTTETMLQVSEKFVVQELGEILRVRQESCSNGSLAPISDPATFNVTMLKAKSGSVESPYDPAFNGDAAAKWKASIHFGFPDFESRKQRNMQYRRNPVTRSKLAQLVADELEQVIAEAQAAKKPLRFEQREMLLEDFFLIEVTWVSKGGIQAALGLLCNKEAN